MEKKILKIGEVAKVLGVHPQTIRRWEKLGILKSWRPYKNGARRFNIQEVEKNLGNLSRN